MILAAGMLFTSCEMELEPAPEAELEAIMEEEPEIDYSGIAMADLEYQKTSSSKPLN